jgi:hypothetical protein
MRGHGVYVLNWDIQHRIQVRIHGDFARYGIQFAESAVACDARKPNNSDSFGHDGTFVSEPARR